MRLKALKAFRYATRQLQAGDEFDARNPRDYKLLQAIKHAEQAEQVVHRPRLAKVAKPQQEELEEPLEEKTVPELREMAEDKGIDLPSGYVRKDELVDLIEKSDEE